MFFFVIFGACKNNHGYNLQFLVDDSPSVLANAPNFVEHRHDQSVFSLLTKKHNLFSRHTLDCIDYIRNRTGETKLPIPKPRMSMNIKR